jgi:23S rRNA (uracil1939-C5)-methyltransferase
MRPKLPTGTFRISIESLTFGGAGLGRHEGKVVFVPFAVPGDHLVVRPVEVKKQYTRAEIVRILKPGVGRVDPVCSHFGKCGGCQWQHLEYSRQVEAKRQILEELFHHRFPQTKNLPVTMKASPQAFGYRSRARMQLRGSGAESLVGFFQPGSHIIEDVESCPLLRPSLNEALHSLRQFKRKVDTGSGRQEVDIAASEEEDAWATVRVGSNINEGVSAFLGPGKREEVILRRRIGAFTYSVTPAVFFQANDFLVRELVDSVLQAAKENGKRKALDLFAGVGLFSLPLALQFENVIAVENSSAACKLCSRNASNAKLANIQVVCSDVLEWMRSNGPAAGVDLILLDPPRTGAGPKVMAQIREWAPQNVIYVSCDPQTLCRDLNKLADFGYSIELVEGLDLFPQTYHFETIVRLARG